MKKSLSFAAILSLLAILVLPGVGVTHAQAQSGWNATGWVVSASIRDTTGNANLTQGQALEAGDAYNATLTIKVPNTSTSTPQFQVSLDPKMGPAPGQSQFWSVHTAQYQGYNGTSFTGGAKTVTFAYDQGTVVLSTYFQVPVNFTTPSGNLTSNSGAVIPHMHFVQDNVPLVSVVPASSTGTGSLSVTVQDKVIQAYLTAYNQTADLLPTGKIPQVYSPFVSSVMAEAQALYNLGFPDQGTTLLGTLTSSTFPSPPNNSLQTYLLVGLGAAVVVIVLLAVLMLRSRGKTGFSTTIVSQVQKDLAVIEVTAAKYDRAMADKLKALRNKLGEAS
ncbi:MAG: hypothetical protein OK455_08635 [Thaumarchaeota archaeon]|nr:hypothetical protein [Nitrososphaerota archaeon]